MNEGWYSRLVEAIEKDGRSHRAISLAAGLGPNYVHQMIADGKEPGTAKFVRLLESLGAEASLYVTLGFELTPETTDVLARFSELTGSQRDALLAFLETLSTPPKT